MKIEIQCGCEEKETFEGGSVNFVSEKFHFYINEDWNIIIECCKCGRNVSFSADA